MAVTVSVAWAMLKNWYTGVAAFQFASPDCEACRVTPPDPLRVKVLPKTVAGPETTAKVTANADEALAAKVKGASP